MSEETGKEIYLEYFKRALDFNDTKYMNSLNTEYMYDGVTFYDLIKREKGNTRELFANLLGLSLYTRAPKTQMINGHEVVAPRYDSDYLTKNNIWVFNPRSSNGVSNLIVKLNVFDSIGFFGWFDSEQNALAYAKAHRESK